MTTHTTNCRPYLARVFSCAVMIIALSACDDNNTGDGDDSDESTDDDDASGDDDDTGGDSDTDTDTDSDTDIDGDSDTDTDSDSDTDTDGDSDADSDTDADTDSETDECEPTAEWGTADQLVLGSQTANWSFTGIFDGNGDGAIDTDEQAPEAFSLEDIFCDHKNSVVIINSEET